MRGDALLSPAVTSRLIGEFVARPPDAVAAAGMETLTNREREVVALVAHGLSNDEIADALVLSPATAKTHVSRAGAGPLIAPSRYPYSCRHLARPNIGPYIWFPYRPAYVCWAGPA